MLRNESTIGTRNTGANNSLRAAKGKSPGRSAKQNYCSALEYLS